jgi:alpha-tubulin suppressor-like RCC1 family protein
MTFPVVSCPTRITKLPDIGTLYYIDIAILSVPYTINNVDFNNFYYLAPEYTPGIQTNTTIEMFTDCEYVKSTYLIKIDLIEDTPPPPPSPTLPSCFDIYYTRYNNTLPIDITLEGLPPNVKYQITQFPTTGILQILDMNNYVVDSLNNPTNTLTYTPLDNTVSVEFKYTVSNNETTTTDECSVFIFYDRDAINISAGRNFSYVLRTDNVLRTFGDNTCCQLADGSGSTMSDVPTTAILPFSGANIKDFDCGYNHSILHYYVNEGNDHKIFLIGDNTYGQLGIPQSTTKQCSFIETPLNNNGILDISAGAYHTCYIRNDNFNTHITGRNNKGQLGNGTYIDRYAFDDVLVKESKKISNLQDAIKVSCGFEHTGFITKATSISSTSVWLTGSNEFGQINQTNSSGLPGHMTTSVYALKAKDNIYFGNCIDISCGDYHTMLLDSNGQVYTFGNNVHGQLGVPLGPPFYEDYKNITSKSLWR